MIVIERLDAGCIVFRRWQDAKESVGREGTFKSLP